MKKEKKGIFIFKIILCVFLSFACGVGATVASAFMPVFLQTAEDFYFIEYGFPVPFVQQTTTVVPNPSFFPMYFTPKYQHESFETETVLESFIISAVINVLIFAVIIFCIWFIHRLYRKNHPKKIRINKKDLYRPVFSDDTSK